MATGMNFCNVTSNPNTHLGKASQSSHKYGENGILGERIRGSLKNSIWVKQVTSSLKTEKRVSKAKPGIALAVLTSNNTKEALVSYLISSMIRLIKESDSFFWVVDHFQVIENFLRTLF